LSSLQSLTIDELVETFDALGDWEAQCDYLIDIGLELPEFPDEARSELNRVHGCQSNVWLVTSVRPNDPPTVEILADKELMKEIRRGLRIPKRKLKRYTVADLFGD